MADELDAILEEVDSFLNPDVVSEVLADMQAGCSPAELVDKRSRSLLAEFDQHYADMVAENPDMSDPLLVHNGWLLQKVSGLQVSLVRVSVSLNSILAYLELSQ